MYGDACNLPPQLDKSRPLRWPTIDAYLCQCFLERRPCSDQLSAANDAVHEGDYFIAGFARSKIGYCTCIQIDSIYERVTILYRGHTAFQAEVNTRHRRQSRPPQFLVRDRAR